MSVGIRVTGNPYHVSGKGLLDEMTKLDYHAEGILHDYWTSRGGPVGGTSDHGIWLLRCFMENGVQRRKNLPISC
ncbi:hypothetical protein TNCV_3428941 [Trichonephila clavipes]|nr:hypothetical protein TNCV_3428941 [Trichonephila clavipes]